MCRYYRYAYIGTDTDTNINIGTPLVYVIQCKSQKSVYHQLY